MNEYIKKTKDGTNWMTIMTVFSTLVRFVTMMIISRILLPEDFGIISSILIIVSFGEVFWQIGVGPSIVHNDKLTNNEIRMANSVTLLLGILIFVLVYSFSSKISLFLSITDQKYLQLFSFVFLIKSVSNVSEAYLQKIMDFKKIAISEITSIIFFGISAVTFVSLGLRVWGLVYAYLLQYLSKSILLYIFKPILPTINFEFDKLKLMLKYGIGFTLGKISNNIAVQGDYFVINRTLGQADLGYYNRAYQLLMYPTKAISQIADRIYFPLVSKLKKKIIELRNSYINLNIIILFVTMPIISVGFIYADDIINIILGSNWESVVLPFKILVVSLYFRISYKLAGTLLKGTGRVYLNFSLQLVYGILIVTLAYIGSRFGIIGVAYGVSLSLLLNYILHHYFILRILQLPLRTFLNSQLPIFVLNLVGFVVLNIVNNINLRTFISVIVSLSSYILVMGIGVIIVGKFSNLPIFSNIYDAIHNLRKKQN